jgi:hypothetical protein
VEAPSPATRRCTIQPCDKPTRTIQLLQCRYTWLPYNRTRAIVTNDVSGCSTCANHNPGLVALANGSFGGSTFALTSSSFTNPGKVGASVLFVPSLGVVAVLTTLFTLPVTMCSGVPGTSIGATLVLVLRALVAVGVPPMAATTRVHQGVQHGRARALFRARPTQQSAAAVLHTWTTRRAHDARAARVGASHCALQLVTTAEGCACTVTIALPACAVSVLIRRRKRKRRRRHRIHPSRSHPHLQTLHVSWQGANLVGPFHFHFHFHLQLFFCWFRRLFNCGRDID